MVVANSLGWPNRLMAQRFTACRGHIPDMHFCARSKDPENMTANITLDSRECSTAGAPKSRN
jgi:hypothetical protein